MSLPGHPSNTLRLRILEAMKGRTDGVWCSELAEAFGIAPRRVQKSMSGLMGKKLVTRRMDTDKYISRRRRYWLICYEAHAVAWTEANDPQPSRVVEPEPEPVYTGSVAGERVPVVILGPVDRVVDPQQCRAWARFKDAP